MRTKGHISTFFQLRGFGFINSLTADGKLISFFFHIRDCSSEPKINAEVLFTPKSSEKGLSAVDVEVLGVRP